KDPNYLEQVATIIYAAFCKSYGVNPVPPAPQPQPQPQPQPGDLAGTSKLTITAKNKFGNLEVLPNAKVTVVYPDGAKLEQLTDAAGKAIFSNIKTANVEVLITCDGFFGVLKTIALAANSSKSSTVSLTPKFNTTDSTNQNFGSLIGVITDAVDGKRLANAKCYLLYNGVIVDMGFTSSTGVYNFTNLPVGVYTVQATSAGYMPEAQSAKVTEGLQKWNSIKLQRMLVQYASISGNVVDAQSGAAIPNATLSLYQGTTLKEVKVSDASGKYAFTNLTPYSYKIVCKPAVTPEKYSSKTKSSLSVKTGQNLLYSFELTSTTMNGSIRGYVFKYVSSKKTAVMNTTVQIYKNGALHSTVKTGWGAAAGMFSVRDLEPGYYDIKVSGVTKTVKVNGGKITSATIQVN
ncbi:MAG TPA: carboxypeptidase regulatory-like domain-containing protein, partial [bacterium]|nr:carboxypeptidase regulatory-like domain-containing protein [bacterium]